MLKSERSIVLADDDSDDCLLFEDALKELAHNIKLTTTNDGMELMDYLDETVPPPPDVIFLDINLPVMTGWQFLTKLKSQEQYKDIPVIMYSTSNNQRDRDTAKDLGALCFITKPSAFKKLQNTLDVIVSYSNKQLYNELCNAVYRLKN